jgi:hypothetical protein
MYHVVLVLRATTSSDLDLSTMLLGLIKFLETEMLETLWLKKASCVQVRVLQK